MSIAPKLSLSSVLAESWRLTRRHWLISVVPVLLTSINSSEFSAWMNKAYPPEQAPLSAFFVMLFHLAFTWAVLVGLMRLMIAVYDGECPSFRLFTDGARRFFSTAVCIHLYLACALAGLVCLLVPGIIVFGRLSCCWMAMLDGGMGPIAALRASWRLTRGQTLLSVGLLPSMALLGLQFLLAEALWGRLMLDALAALNFSVFLFAQIHIYRRCSAQDALSDRPVAA